MKSKWLHCFLVLWVCFIMGCRAKDEPNNTIVLIDTSGSIESSSLSDAFDSIVEMAKGLHRGDSLTVIPIASNAPVDTPGRVLRFVVPGKREGYDADLTHFYDKVSESLGKLRSSSVAHPTKQTDILGALEVAREEARGFGLKNTKLVILSDFVQDDSRLNFKIDPRLTTDVRAKTLARQMNQATTSQRQFGNAYLGLLRSKELSTLSHARIAGIKAFWETYLAPYATDTKYYTDALGIRSRLK